MSITCDAGKDVGVRSTLKRGVIAAAAVSLILPGWLTGVASADVASADVASADVVVADDTVSTAPIEPEDPSRRARAD